MHRKGCKVAGTSTEPGLMRYVLVLLMALTLATPALAAEETKPLDEVQALRIRVLMLERQLIQDQVARVQAQGQLQFEAKTREIDQAVLKAAKEAGLEPPEAWWPDVETRQWKKR